MAGFRTFATGEVLTAANVNDFLMKQSVMVFADAAARDTALGTAVGGSNAIREGMLAYLEDTDEVKYYDGTAWADVAADVSSLDASVITSGTFDAARIPSLDAAKITSGTFDGARLPEGGYVLAPVAQVLFTASGTFSKGSYPWLRAVRVRLVGGGGGGAGSGGVNFSSGGSGGGGGYSEKVIPVGSLAASETVTVGGNGSAGPNNTNGGNGGTSSFGSFLQATGGEGGKRRLNSPARGGLGGVGSGGDFNTDGQGGIGPSSGNGASSPGGSSLLGGGAPGTYHNDTNPPAQVAASGFGGGGAGGYQWNTGQAGSTGKAGVVIVELFA